MFKEILKLRSTGQPLPEKGETITHTVTVMWFSITDRKGVSKVRDDTGTCVQVHLVYSEGAQTCARRVQYLEEIAAVSGRILHLLKIHTTCY